ncbi:MAG: polymer-forming cytoskeletal protein [Polyangiaceae bacterium]|nr:polymer-forming cytoskeletal protein [Polyangiaceae bacterium]
MMAKTARSHADVGSEAVIGRATRVRGRVSGDGSLRIEGSIEGDISLRGDLTVDHGARAASNIDAQAVTIRGELAGDVQAQGVVRIEVGAKVRGDMHGESVTIEEGAEFTGHLATEFDLPPELSENTTNSGRRR